MKDRIIKLISNKYSLVIVFAIFALFAGIQSLSSGTKTFSGSDNEYSSYNNYTIFEKSFHHLKNKQDLYILYPDEHWDLYKYTPTFSVFFGVFAVFPDWIGLNLWNLLNAFILLFAVYYLPRSDNFEKGVILLIILIELMTCMQNEQSNALIAGLLVLSFGLLENKKYLFAALCIVFSGYIKLFGIVGFALFLFYPQKWKLALYTVFWTTLLFILPCLFVSIDQYIFLFHSYGDMLFNDHSASYGYSVMGWLNSWFDIENYKNIIVVTGMVIFLFPLIRFKEYKNYTFKYLTLTSILIWIVIFNHKAESPTFIIAMTGVSLWFVKSEKSSINIVLFVIAFILTSLSPTDIFPGYLREEFVKTYTLKAFPCILIWLKIIYDMIRVKEDRITAQFNAKSIINIS